MLIKFVLSTGWHKSFIYYIDAVSTTDISVSTCPGYLQVSDMLVLSGVCRCQLMSSRKNLAREENKTRHDLRRDEFVRRVWDWKNQ